MSASKRRHGYSAGGRGRRESERFSRAGRARWFGSRGGFKRARRAGDHHRSASYGRLSSCVRRIHTGGVWRVLRSSGRGPGTAGSLGIGTGRAGRAAAGALRRPGRQVIGDAHQRRHRVVGPVLLVLRALLATAGTDCLHGRRSVRRRPGSPAGGQRQSGCRSVAVGHALLCRGG